MIRILPTCVARRKVQMNLTPDRSLLSYEGVGATDIGLGFALAEIIANSLDWSLLTKTEARNISQDASIHAEAQKTLTRLEDEYGSLAKLISNEQQTIEITVTKDKILVVDRGVGMTHQELETGWKLRAASDKVRAPLRQRKGQFGMGLKTSSLSLGNIIEIHTRSIKTPGETVIFTYDQRDKDGDWDDFYAEIDDEKDPDSPLGNYENGTAVVITELFKKNHDDLTAAEILGDIFHHAIEGGANIIFNDIALKPDIPEMNEDVLFINFENEKICPGGLWVKEDLGGGRRGEPIQIKGWIGLMKKTRSGDLQYGFHTFRRGQLIEMYHNDGTRSNPKGLFPYTGPHAECARLFGHIHLDMVPPNFHKKGWNYSSPAWDEVREILKPVIDPIVTLARRTKKDVKASQDLLRAHTRFVTTGTWTKPKKKRTKRKKTKSEPEKPKVVTPFNMDGSDYSFLPPIEMDDPEGQKAPWSFIADHSSKEIQMFTNTNHPIWKFSDYKSNKMLEAFAKIDIFCQAMSDNGKPPAEVQKKREILYREVFGGNYLD